MVITSKKQSENWIDLGPKIRMAAFLLIPRGQLLKKSDEILDHQGTRSQEKKLVYRCSIKKG